MLDHDNHRDVSIVRMPPRAAGDAAIVHAAAFPRHFLTSLGLPFLRLYYAAVADDDATIALCAMVDDRLVGLCVGAVDPRGFYSRLLKQRWLAFALQGLRAAALRPRALPRLLSALSHPSSQVPDPDAAGLFSLGVSPELQGRGIGGALVRSFVEESRARGGRLVVLETDETGNDGVIAFYERLGFVVSQRYTTPEGRAMRRYVLSLRDPLGSTPSR